MVMSINTYREKAAVAAAISKPCTLHRAGTGVYYIFAHGVLHAINMVELAGGESMVQPFLWLRCTTGINDPGCRNL